MLSALPQLVPGEVNRRVSITVHENVSVNESRDNKPLGFCCSFEISELLFSHPRFSLSHSEKMVTFYTPCVAHEIQVSNVQTRQQTPPPGASNVPASALA